MKDLHIAVVRQKYNPYGGAERFVERALGALSQTRVDITVVSRAWDAGKPGYQYVLCNPFYIGRLWRDMSFKNSVCRKLEDLPVDIVQSHERIPCTDIYRAGDGVHKVWLSRKNDAGSWLTRIFNQSSLYHRHVLAAEKRMFESKNLKAVICNSRMVRDEILEHFDIAEEKLHVIYSGVDTEHFNPRLKNEYGDAMRQQHGIEQQENVLVFVGSGFFRKGLDTIIVALAKLQSPPVLVVVGYDKHIGKYRKRVKQLRLQDRVIFTGPQKDVRPYYGMADAFILPSLYDPFPNAALEAMACGLPVITSYTSGASELIEEGVDGFVVESMDSEGIAGVLLGFNSSFHPAEAGKKARIKVEAYNLNVMADKLVDFYSQVIGQHS